jgi:hypothetical protein
MAAGVFRETDERNAPAVILAPRRENDMSTSDRHDAERSPNVRGAEELERRRQSELAGQKHATEEADAKFGSGAPNHSVHEPEGCGSSDADQAKENERQAEKDGRELPG